MRREWALVLLAATLGTACSGKVEEGESPSTGGVPGNVKTSSGGGAQAGGGFSASGGAGGGGTTNTGGTSISGTSTGGSNSAEDAGGPGTEPPPNSLLRDLTPVQRSTLCKRYADAKGLVEYSCYDQFAGTPDCATARPACVAATRTVNPDIDCTFVLPPGDGLRCRYTVEEIGQCIEALGEHARTKACTERQSSSPSCFYGLVECPIFAPSWGSVDL